MSRYICPTCIGKRIIPNIDKETETIQCPTCKDRYGNSIGFVNDEPKDYQKIVEKFQAKNNDDESGSMVATT